METIEISSLELCLYLGIAFLAGLFICLLLIYSLLDKKANKWDGWNKLDERPPVADSGMRYEPEEIDHE